jgi:hypothetical protein
MFPLQVAAGAALIKPQSVASTATVTGVLDTLGYDEVKVCVLLDSAATTSDNPSTLKLSESDDLTTYADITGLEGDATDGFTIPLVSGTLPTVVDLNVDCRARKRYLKLTLTPGEATMIVGATAVLGKAEQSPTADATV